MKREKGFTLFIVIILLMLIGLAMGVLGNISKNFADKTVSDEIKIYNRQMLQSGQAWINENIDKLSQIKTGESVTLDTAEFSAKSSWCIIKVIDVAENEIKTEISVGMSKGRIYTSRSTEIVVKM